MTSPTQGEQGASAAGGAVPSVSNSFDPEPAARLHLMVWWIFCGACLLILIALAGTVAIVTSRERALTLAERELQNLAFVLATRTNNSFEISERAQDALASTIVNSGLSSPHELASKFSGFEAHQQLYEKHSGLPHIGAFSLLGASGDVVNSSRSWPPTESNQAHKSFFIALRDNVEQFLSIGEPAQDRSTGTWGIQFARKILLSNGQFGGVLVATVELDEFEREFQPIVLGEGGSIALFRADGVLLSRYPRIEKIIGKKFTAGLQGLPDRGRGTVRIIGEMEGKDRLLSIHKLPNFPLFITAGLDVQAALSSWRKEAMVIAFFGLFSAALVAIIFILVGRQLSRQSKRSEQRLILEKQRLKTAINNMTQGLLLFDSHERIVVCNRRYIDMYGLSPDVVKSGCTFSDLIAHRRDTGSFIGDVGAYRESAVRALSQGRPTETTIDTPDGRTIQIVNRPLENGGWVATHEDITERKKTDERIRRLAQYDALTNLPNRALFREHLEQQLNWVHRGAKLAVLYLDLDHFKSINDTLGHPVGDELLVSVATRLRGCIRDIDLVARLGGDEFAIIQAGVEKAGDVTRLAERVRKAIREPFDFGGHHVITDTSIGIALAPLDGAEPDVLLKNADLALYGAKANGRGTYRFFEAAMDDRAKARRALEFDLREAIMCSGFELHYQPIMDIRRGSVVGFEALLRWPHPGRGMVPPNEFIPLAEETGLINQLGEWVLNTACTEAARWPGQPKVAVNVSPVQFKNQGLPLIVVKALSDSGLAASRLELEITEAVLIKDDEEALTILHQLRDLGVRIAMDDFGTGFSSLSYLHRFPFDKIKIDRCFIKAMADNDGSRAIVKAVVEIARARNITTTAEGVETEEQRIMLRRIKCDEMQGYLVSAAKPASEILSFLPDHSERKTA